MKQTALDWYWDKIKSHFEHDGDLLETASFTFAIAKEKEREQIEDAYYDGQSLNAKSVTSQMIIDNSISYYNEIYKGGEQ